MLTGHHHRNHLHHHHHQLHQRTYFHDWVGNLFYFLLLFTVFFSVGLWIVLQPVESFVNNIFQFLLVSSTNADLLFVIIKCILEVVEIRFKSILSINTFLNFLIFFCELLCLTNHSFNLFFTKTSLLSCDSNLFGLSSSLVFSRYLKNTVGINLECDINLWNTTWCRRNSSKLELS